MTVSALKETDSCRLRGLHDVRLRCCALLTAKTQKAHRKQVILTDGLQMGLREWARPELGAGSRSTDTDGVPGKRRIRRLLSPQQAAKLFLFARRGSLRKLT